MSKPSSEVPAAKRQFTLTKAIAGFGLVLFLVSGATAAIVSNRLIEIVDYARKTQDEILPASVQRAVAAVATERLLRLTLEMAQTRSDAERQRLMGQAKVIAEPLTRSTEISQKTAGVSAVAAIQKAAAAVGRNDEISQEIVAAVATTDRTISKIAEALKSIVNDSEEQINRYLLKDDDFPGPGFGIQISKRLKRIFEINAAARSLMQEVREARVLVHSALIEKSHEKLGLLHTEMINHRRRVSALLQIIPSKGGYEYLPNLIEEKLAGRAVIEMRMLQIDEEDEKRQSLSVATSTLSALANELSLASSNLASESTTGILAGLESIKFAFAIGGLVILGLIVLIGVMAQRMIVRPLARSAHVLSELSEGRMADAPPHSTLRELNALSGAVASFAGALRSMEEMRRLKSASDDEEERNASMRHEMRVLANEFESTVIASVTQIGRSADELRQSSDFMSDAISATESLSDDSQTRATQARHNVDGVAAASREIASGISEIETAADAAARQSQQGASAAARAKSAVSGLTVTADRIGEVVDLVSEITKRTNLLALNATIEAARAGEAGRGFAVVAGEVKQLAGQTAEAAAEIVEHVKAIRAGVTETSDQINTIADVVAATANSADRIAASVSQQASTTRDIASRAGGAAEANGAVADIISQLNEKARSSNIVVEQVAIAANEMHDVADTLRGNVDGFLTGLRDRASM